MPRVYFARAIDDVYAEQTRALAGRVSRELADVGSSLVDPLATEPAEPAASADRLQLYRAIVDHDLAVLRSCEAVLMDMSLPNRNYIGCTCELVYAYMWRIPVAVYLGSNDRNRPWLLYHASAVFEHRLDAIAYLTGCVSEAPE